MSTDSQPPDTARKLPVWRTIGESYGFVFSNLDRFAVLACVPILIVFGAELANHLIHSLPASWMFTLVSLGAWIVFVVRWHRLILLGDRGGAFRAVLAPRNLRVFAYVLVMFLILRFTLPIIIRMAISLLDFLPFPATTAVFPGTVPEIAGLPVWLSKVLLLVILVQTPLMILWFLAVRFILVLPGAAIDRRMRIVDAWRDMRGNCWRCIGTLIIVVILPFNIVDIIVSLYWPGLITGTITVVGTELSSELRMPINLEDGIYTNLVTVFDFFGTALAITVLSIFYRHIIGMDAPEGGAHARAEDP